LYIRNLHTNIFVVKGNCAVIATKLLKVLANEDMSIRMLILYSLTKLFLLTLC